MEILFSYRGRPIYYAGIIAIIFGYLTFGKWGALAGLSFAIWRGPGWFHSIDAGTNEDSKLRDFLVMSLRGLCNILFFAMVFNVISAAYPFILLVVSSFGMGAMYRLAWMIRPKDPVAMAEIMCGLIWGISYWLVLKEIV